MRVFKTKEFDRTARREKVAADGLRKAVERTLAGKIDADLGAFLIKQRVSQGKGGRSGGHRAVIVFIAKARLVFVHLFAKNAKANLGVVEERAFKKAAKIIAGLTEDQVRALVQAEEWLEIEHGEDGEDLSE